MPSSTGESWNRPSPAPGSHDRTEEWHSDFEADRARDRALVALGYLVIRASYRQVMQEWPVIECQIAEIVARRDHLWRRSLTQGLRHPPSTEAVTSA